MRKRWFFYMLALVLHIVAWIPATSRVITTNHAALPQKLSGNGGTPESFQTPYSSIQKSKKISKAESYRGMNEPGSRPPNCEHKCDGCNPCIAIQVPTMSGHVGVQYANYEPISWKCKCGATFYSP